MFEYFFILGTMFLLISGSIDEFRLNRVISFSVLTILFFLTFFSDVGIKYTVYFSLSGVFILALSIIMFLIMPDEHLSTLLYSLITGLIVYAIIIISPGFNIWYFKAVVLSVLAAMLSVTYFQGIVISVFSCFMCDLLVTISTMDIELFSMLLFTGENKTAVIVAFVLPVIIMSLASKKQKEIKMESLNGIT